MGDTHKYIFVYQTICTANGKTYVGVHSTDDIDDGYIGCGIYCFGGAKGSQRFHRAVKKYGYAAFKRHILSFYDTYEEALEEERYIVNKKWVKDESNYNLALGGKGYTLAYLGKDELSNKFKGDKNHRFGKPAHNRKSVIKYDLSFNEIKRFDSLFDAAKEINDKGSNISRCCIGRYSQCGGYIYRYEKYSDQELEILNNNLSKRKRIYNQDGTWTVSEDVKQKLKGIKRKPRKEVSAETRLKQSIARKGKKTKPCSEERKKKIGDANRGRKMSLQHIENYKKGKDKYKKPVIAYDKFGNLAFEFESLRDAKRNGFDMSAIKRCISGICNYYKGYSFKFKSTY